MGDASITSPGNVCGDPRLFGRTRGFICIELVWTVVGITWKIVKYHALNYRLQLIQKRRCIHKCIDERSHLIPIVFIVFFWKGREGKTNNENMKHYLTVRKTGHKWWSNKSIDKILLKAILLIQNFRRSTHNQLKQSEGRLIMLNRPGKLFATLWN